MVRATGVVAAMTALLAALGLAAPGAGLGSPGASAASPATSAPSPGSPTAYPSPTASPSASPTATSVPASGLHWHGCPGDEAYGGTQCAALKVPLDYSHPAGATITLELARQRHSASHPYKGVMLVNLGGPGEPGLDAVSLQDDVPHGVGRDYDWVSWDPRGVGESTPSISCDRHYFDPPRPSYSPTSTAKLHYWMHRSKAYAQRCESKYPNLLRHMTTEDSARDMNAIRLALGVSKVSYYGFSYGTYLGQVYATLFGSHLQRMVLDSNVDPRRVWYAANLDQDKAFNRNITLWFHWVARYHHAYGLGATERAVRHRYYKDLHALARHHDGRLGAAEWVDAFTEAAYYRFTWDDVAQAWKSYTEHGHIGALMDLYADSEDPGDDNSFAVYSAVQCTDTTWPTTWSRWAADNKHYNAKYPFLTWSNAWFNAPCLYWGAPAHTPVHIARAPVQALLIDETLDAATPYRGSLEVRKLFTGSRLIGEPGGTSHADSLDGNACVDDRIAAYLKTGALPKRRSGTRSDVTCKPLSAPHPYTGDARAAARSASRRGPAARPAAGPQRLLIRH